MTTQASYRPIIQKWPSPAEFGADLGIKDAHVRTFKMRDSIPADYWERIVEAAIKRGISGVTVAVLARIAAKRKRKKSRSHKNT